MSLDTPQANTSAMPKAPTPPVLASGPQGSKPKKKPSQPSFLGTEAMPQATQRGGNTLLGQA